MMIWSDYDKPEQIKESVATVGRTMELFRKWTGRMENNIEQTIERYTIKMS